MGAKTKGKIIKYTRLKLIRDLYLVLIIHSIITLSSGGAERSPLRTGRGTRAVVGR